MFFFPLLLLVLEYTFLNIKYTSRDTMCHSRYAVEKNTVVLPRN